MKIKKYANFKKALEAIIKKDKDYFLVRHILQKGEKINLHFHKKANEWIIADSGKFAVKIGKEEKIFDIKNQISVIYFPRKKAHDLQALSKISYLVLRDKKDKTIYYRS